MRTPLLIISDSPSCTSGLGRICRDLAIRVSTQLSDIYDCATLGYGGPGDRNLPFPQYVIEGMHDWFIPTLPDVWDNFAGDRKGIVFTIWDASRLLWFARPEPQWCHDGRMRKWLKDAPFKRWGYFPIDATGPNNKLSVMQRECMLGYDRILSYSKWAEQITRNTIDEDACESKQVTTIPHGIDTNVFRRQSVNRSLFHDELQFGGPPIEPDEKIIGMVGTNQVRKDWGLAFDALARVAKNQRIRIYAQVDIIQRHWDIAALVLDYGLIPNTIVNANGVTDAMMARIYSLCDLTLGIGLGEGFGYSTFESLACGTPHITGSYGGQAEHLSKDYMIDPVFWRLEGLYDCVRPVYDPAKWAYRIEKALRIKTTGESLLPKHLDWNNLWPRWENWFRSGQSHPSQALAPVHHDSKSETDTARSDRNRSTVASRAILSVDVADPFVSQLVTEDGRTLDRKVPESK